MNHMFSFNNNYMGGPADLIYDASRALSAVSAIFRGVKAPELNEDDASGIHSILDGIRCTLDSVYAELARARANEGGPGHAA